MQHTFEQHLTPQELLKLRNNRTGLLIFQLSWILVFVSLIFVNWLIRSNTVSWPPEGVERLPVLPPLLATAALVLSSVLVQRGEMALKAGNLAAFFRQWAGTLVLGIVFTALMVYQLAVVPGEGQYGAIFRVMTIYHLVHAMVIGLFVWRTYRFTRAGVYGPENFWMVEAAAKLWHFVTIAWLLFFVVLYVI